MCCQGMTVLGVGCTFGGSDPACGSPDCYGFDALVECEVVQVLRLMEKIRK